MLERIKTECKKLKKVYNNWIILYVLSILNGIFLLDKFLFPILDNQVSSGSKTIQLIMIDLIIVLPAIILGPFAVNWVRFMTGSKPLFHFKKFNRAIDDMANDDVKTNVLKYEKVSFDQYALVEHEKSSANGVRTSLGIVRYIYYILDFVVKLAFYYVSMLLAIAVVPTCALISMKFHRLDF